MTTPSPFPPIAEYAFLSDCHTGALVAPDGSVEWLCVPWFDSPSAFSALLDRGAGAFRVGPYGNAVPAARRYIPGTNVLETTWMTKSGWLVVRDALTVGPWRDDTASDVQVRPPTDFDAERMLVRTIACTYGEVPLEVVCEPQFEYGALGATWEAEPAGEGCTSFVTTSGGEPPLRLTSDLRCGIEGDRVRARHVMREGETAFVALSWRSDADVPRNAEDAFRRIDRTCHFWRRWLESGEFPDHPWRVHLQRSALVLKGLTFQPTGALVAAPTTSLPETPGGERNWDYRYCWMRDAAFTLWGLHALGMDWEAEDFLQYVADLERNEDGSLQIMYGIRGQKDLTESTLDHLKGYEGARPVRIGNGAFDQRQNDVYGAVLDSVYIHTKATDHIPERLWPVLVDQVEAASRVWHLPDQGIWEARGEPQHYVSSKVMCWVALDRGAALARLRGDEELAARWEAVAGEIKADVLARGVSDRGVFRQHYGTDALDASTLLIPLQRFLPPDDERVRNTAMAIAEELTENGLVLRYRVEETDDGLHGREGTFLICSFWLVSVLSEIGERERARALCERLLSYAGPLRLYAEELDAESGRHLGNYPQAFTHLALINAVSHVIADETPRPR
ncbi:MAG: glycoside hydrolase family 15 protein [Solirubrobacteraceae bacterium]|nr:glycoside hydrolase family 15 protein [Solirubrobacteraceae bacterium]